MTTIMKKISLSKQVVDLLTGLNAANEFPISCILDAQLSMLEIHNATNDELHNLRDYFVNLFIRYGVEDDSEPTKLGIELDDIAGILNQLLFKVDKQ